MSRGGRHGIIDDRPIPQYCDTAMAHILFGDDPADALVGSADGSAGDESINHDHYLYGWPREVATAPPESPSSREQR